MAEDFSPLRRRLDLLRRSLAPQGPPEEARPGGSTPGSSAGPAEPPDGLLPALLEESGWVRTGTYSWRRRASLGSLADFRLDGLLPDGRPSMGGGLFPGGARPPSAGAPPPPPLFLDLETTGLSGGTGNSIFLAGLAWPEGGELVGEQFFLADFPGEPEYLELLSERLQPGRVLVTYNGKCFDTQLIRTRFLLNGRLWEPGEQLDLLYWARRLWKRTLGDCSLGSIERNVLGVERGEDVPGWEIPDIYFRYLKTGRPGRLPVVFEHNFHDVRSLARLLALLGRALSGGEMPPRADGASLGRWLLRSRRPGGRRPEGAAAGEVAGEVAAAAGEAAAGRTAADSGTAAAGAEVSRAAAGGAGPQGAGPADEPRGIALLRSAFLAGELAAGRTLSLFLKQTGRWTEALELWRQMAGRRSLFAAVELAKYYEHRSKDFGAALEWVERILGWALPLPALERAGLIHRRERLLRRMQRRDAPPRSRSS